MHPINFDHISRGQTKDLYKYALTRRGNVLGFCCLWKPSNADVRAVAAILIIIQLA